MEETADVRVRPLSDDGAVEQPRTRPRTSSEDSANRFRGRQPVQVKQEQQQQPEVEEKEERTSFHSDPFQTDFVSGPPRPRKLPVNTPPSRTKTTTEAPATTPPSHLSRVRGRPIVPSDFPGPTAAVRAGVTKRPSRISNDVDDEEDDDANLTGARRVLSRSRFNRPGLRIVPTGQRARRPVSSGAKEREQVKEEEVKEVEDIPETPRASSVTGSRLNRVQAKDSSNNNNKADSRRRLRPIINRNRALVTPRRRLRPIGERNEVKSTSPPSRRRNNKPDPANSSFFKPSIQTTTTTETPTTKSVIDELHTTNAVAFDPNILIAQVQATKADEDRAAIGTTGSRSKLKNVQDSKNKPPIDDSEESNIIPFADVAVPAVPPSAEGAPTAFGAAANGELDDEDITVINLQKDKGKQNFKGFVDTDLIDDSLRHNNNNDNHQHQHAFIPTRSPVVTAPPPPPPVTPEAEPETTTPPPFLFVPTSLPAQRNPPPPKTSTEGRRVPSINDKLDRLQSNLDPWAHINQNEDASTPSPSTVSSTTPSSRLSLFRVRTHAPKTATTSTTTFRPRSLADLFKHRNGEKVIYTGDQSEKRQEEPERPRSSSGSSNNNSNTFKTTTESSAGINADRLSRLKARLNRFKAATSATESSTDPTPPPTPLPAFNPDLYATTNRDIILSGFRASTTTRKTTTTELEIPTTTERETTTTERQTTTTEKETTTTTEKQTTTTEKKPQTVQDVLSKIPKDPVAAFLPPNFQARPPTTARPSTTVSTNLEASTNKKSGAKSLFEGLQEDDVSSFLPPGYRPTTTSTESSTDLLKDILSSIEEIDESLLPKGFKQPTKGFKPKGPPRRTTTTAASTTSTEKEEEETTTKKDVSALHN